MTTTRRPAKGAPRGLTVERLLSIERISQPAVSPDGRRVAYVRSNPDLEGNSIRSTLFLLDLDTKEDRELTPGPGNHNHPAWSPDGDSLAFVSSRDDESGSQVWILPMQGGEAVRITEGYGGAGQPVWAPDGRRIAFSRQVVVSEQYAAKKSDEVDPRKGPGNAQVYGLVHPKSSARVEDELLFRHWDHWRDRRRSHLFLVDVRTRRSTDLTPFDCDVPPISLGSDLDYAFSPDGAEIAYVMNPDEVVACSTNNSIFVQRLSGIRAKGEPQCVSASEANDNHPRYSPDGRFVVYLGMEVPGYEADKTRIKLYDRETGETHVLLDRFDRSPSTFDFVIGEDGRETSSEILFQADDRGRQTLYRVAVDSGRVLQLTSGTFNGTFRTIPNSPDLLVTRETVTQPADLYRLRLGTGIKPDLRPGPARDEPATQGRSSSGRLAKHDGTTGGGRTKEERLADAGSGVDRLTHVGKAVEKVEMEEAEEFWFAGAGGHPVHGFLVKPPGFHPSRKHPLILLIHGGPQTAFADHFHYRWNVQVFASRGAVVATINPRGSTGYGQKFTDQISGDWGGRAYQDLMLGVDHLIKTYRFIDANRMAAAGASFGGFMVNWIAGHTDRFKALVTHDGVFFSETMAYTTEELWFDMHEHGGLPHENRGPFLKYSPHRFVENFKTPTLVVHGSLDYRCPMSEGLGMFTALQTKGVPSRFLHFPDEGHWVLKLANAQVWYHEVLGWMMRYIGNAK